jgi:hypothetical protein
MLAKRQTVEEVPRWTRAHSVSEAVKTELFLFLTRSDAYSNSDRQQRDDAEAQRLQNEASDLRDGCLARVRVGIAGGDVLLPGYRRRSR